MKSKLFRTWLKSALRAGSLLRRKMSFILRSARLKSGLRAGFMPRTLISLILLGVSLGLAAGVYSFIQNRNQAALFEAWLSADPIPAFCDGFPHLSAEICRAAQDSPAALGPSQPQDDLSQLLFAVFLASEVIDLRTYPTSVDFAGKLPDELHAIRSTFNDLLRDHRDQGGKQTGLGLVTKLSFRRCLNQNLDAENITNAPRVAAYILSDGPGGPDSVLGGNRSCSAARVEASELDFKKTVQSWSSWRLSPSMCLGPRDAMRVLAQRANAISSGPTGDPGYNLDGSAQGCLTASRWMGPNGTPLTPADFLAAQDHMTRIIETLLSEMASTPEIKDANTTLRMWRGIENIGILSLSIFVFLVLFLRTVMLWDAADEKVVAATDQHAFAVAYRLQGGEGAQARRDYDEGGAYLRWAVGSIAAIGFVGTVRGIFSALPESSEVVFAASRIERAEAIGTLAGELGLAFSTTLFALIAGLILSFILLLATRLEAWQMTVLRDRVEKMPPKTESAS
jgi:hypothetical protein